MSLKIEQFIPVLQYEGLNTDQDVNLSGSVTMSGTVTTSGTVTNSGTMTTDGLVVSHTSKSGAYTTTTSDYIVGVDTTSSAVTITLGTATVTAGRIVVISDEGGSANSNNITIATEGDETLDGGATKTISTGNAAVILYSNGTNWFSVLSDWLIE